MKGNWTQILVFTVLSLILGFVLGRVTGQCGHCGDHMEKRVIEEHMDGDHHMVWHDEEGGTNIFISEGEDEMTITIEALEESGFEGDTLIDGANINISRDGDELRVEVKKEMDGKGSHKQVRIEKEIEEAN